MSAAGDPQDAARPRVGYLGPAGTFTEEALLASARAGAVEPVALASIYDTVWRCARGEVRWAVAPIENSLDGSVTVTLDLLADDASELEIVGEALLAVRHSLIAAAPLGAGEIDTVISHPQVPGQCTRLLRGELAHARVLAGELHGGGGATGGGRAPARDRRRSARAWRPRLYGATVVREGVQDRDDNVTRFVWLAGGPAEAPTVELAPLRAGATIESPPTQWKTSVVFWGAGAEQPRMAGAVPGRVRAARRST